MRNENYFTIHNKDEDSIYLDIEKGVWGYENQKPKSVELEEAFDIFRKEYEKICDVSFENDNFREVVIRRPMHWCGPVAYEMSCYKYIHGYRIKNRCLVAEIHQSGLFLSMRTHYNFPAVTAEKNISHDQALQSAIKAVKKNYLKRSWLDDTGSVRKRVMNSLYPLFQYVFGYKKIEYIFSHNDLFMVNPNELFKTKSYIKYSNEIMQCNELKLAYEFVFGIKTGTIKRLYHIWINAQNGKLIGGRWFYSEEVDRCPELYAENIPVYSKFSYDTDKKIWIKKEIGRPLPLVVYKNGEILKKPYQLTKKEFMKWYKRSPFLSFQLFFSQ